MSADRIERETFIAAPRERVWQVITQAEHVGRWFGDAGAEIDLRPGGAMTMTWEEHGTARAVVEAVEEPERFAFRWASEAGEDVAPGRSTLVEFSLAPESDGTRLRVVESGFASLDVSEDERVAKFEGNTEGWQIELGHLADYLAESPALR
jgi:uncharacterized protein YndB with AHSA1/START domain